MPGSRQVARHCVSRKLCLPSRRVASEGATLFTPVYKNGGRAVVDDGAAGEAAVGVGAAGGGRERDGEMRPVQHVGADGVGPVHVSPDGGVGVVLEKHVIAALEVERAVGIVHPVACGEEMELGAEGVGGELGLGDEFGEGEIFGESGEGGGGG